VQRILHRILLFFLRALIYLKRFLLRVFHGLLYAWAWVAPLYRKTIGFYLYKFFFLFKKRLGEHVSPGGGWVFGQLLQRGVLQWIFLLLALFLSIPESKWYVRDETQIPGRHTLVYVLAGPGDQDFSLEEITSDAAPERPVAEESSWRSGALVAEPAVTEGSQIAPREESLGGTSLGGVALTKPTIIPGATLPGAGSTAERTEIALYTVQSGDVIGSIARSYGVSIETILWANSLTARSYIRPGDQLKIPPTSGVLHTVKKGETVAKIAKLYKAKDQEIIAFNKLQSGGSDIVVGEVLMVPGGVKASAAPASVIRYAPVAGVAAPPSSIEAPAGSGYVWPAGVRRITQYFGLRHTGVDIAGPVGTPIYAARSGVVTRSSCGWNGGYGCYIVIDHGGGVNTAYGHSSKLFVSVGQYVNQGETISLMGSTGNSTGPHLHFEVRANGRRNNPLKYIR
jgi:murein DD-endopeptidase MepM/ murein hydrolase activator NlpD